ncbi:MAG: zinc-ribbon domain-containing protein [Candidatus Methanomethylophilaceae archaeon]|nr:zinc-ribbon domain-containing protein [Candidatus Methanomethylophilaceae archaeon]
MKGCPYCTGQRILPGFNDLETKKPELAKQWHPTRNGSLKPSEVFPQSNNKFWWMCPKGHEWYNSPVMMKNDNCPICRKR